MQPYNPAPEVHVLSGEWAILSPEATARNFAVVVADGKIIKTGPRAEIEKEYPDARYYGGDNCILMPGMFNTHTHLFQTFIKGAGKARDLPTWIATVTSPAALAMTPEDGYLTAMLGLMEAVRSGTSFVAEYSYAYPDGEVYEGILRAFQEVGVRGWLGMGINDTGSAHGVRPELIQPINTRLKLADRLREDIRSACGDRVALALTPSSVIALSPEGAAAVVEYAHQHHLHWCLHMNETGRDNRVALERSGKKLIPYLDDLGVLDEALVAVHCVQVDRRDVSILGEHGVNVSHNPVCNMYLGSGISPVLSMLKKKITVSLATDGAGSNNSLDMLETLKLAVLAQRLRAKSGNAFEAEDGLRLAMTGGAKTTGLDDQAGRLAEGCLADITILRVNTPKMTPVAEVRQSVVFSCGEENVDTVMVDGKVLLENSRFLAIDEERILAKAREAASNLLRRAQIN